MLDRDDVDYSLLLAFRIQPARKRADIVGVAIFKLRDGAFDQSVALRCICSLEQIKRDEFVRRAAEGMRFKRRAQIFQGNVRRDNLLVVLFFVATAL